VRAPLREEFERALRRYADRIAVEHDGRRLSYADVDRWSMAIARQLRDLGVGPGDAVVQGAERIGPERGLGKTECPNFTGGTTGLPSRAEGAGRRARRRASRHLFFSDADVESVFFASVFTVSKILDTAHFVTSPEATFFFSAANFSLL
jgi:hypothetical protein